MPERDWLGECARRRPEQVAVVDAASGRRHTWRSFDQRANQIAHFCEQWVGLLPGDRIGLLSTPSDDVLQITLAAAKLGLTALLWDPAASASVLVDSMNQHGPRTVFHGLAQAGLVRDIWFEVNSVEHFIPLRGALDTADFEDIVAHYPPFPPVTQVQPGVAWVHFAAEGVTWPDAETAAGEAVPGTLAAPLHRPPGLAAAVGGLRSGWCVVVELDAVTIVEAPPEAGALQEEPEAWRRNVPRGRSWLPHEFR